MHKSIISRGFLNKRPNPIENLRLPPGQTRTDDFPVLSVGPTPEVAIEDWSFVMEVGGSPQAKWTWTEFDALPKTIIKRDIHCVTKWSKLDTTWRGVRFDDLLKAAQLTVPPTEHVMAHCDGGYTTNVAISDLVNGKAMIATHFDEQPLSQAHGGPARLLIPHLYFWKSAKWVRRLRFMNKDEAGFWEALGYHNRGNPWKEERYAGS